MRKKDNEFIELAELISKKSKMHHKIGCCIVHNKKVISIGYNTFSGLNSNIGMADKWSIHAEISALKKAINYIHNKPTAKLTIYVARKKKSLAKPCFNCVMLLTPYIDRFVYTDGGAITEEFTSGE